MINTWDAVMLAASLYLYIFYFSFFRRSPEFPKLNFDVQGKTVFWSVMSFDCLKKLNLFCIGFLCVLIFKLAQTQTTYLETMIIVNSCTT